MDIPHSELFTSLEWDVSLPDFPTLNGALNLKDNSSVEIALVGDRKMKLPWQLFLQNVEDHCNHIETRKVSILQNAEQRILKLHQAYFQNRWSGSAGELLNELSLKMLCFYPDGSFHYWYHGSSIFNHLDVDIGLNKAGNITEVRFDG